MIDEGLRRDAAEHIRTEVARGRSTYAEIVDGAVEYLEDEADEAELRPVVREIAREEFAAHLAAQATWPARTDSDRLTDAFRALDAAGIVAREDFACCQNCGTSEIGDEVLDKAAARGYVFYHMQDAERAADGGGVWLAYGHFGSGATVALGEEIAAALRAEGLTVEWDGSTGQRIHVPLRWARLRHGRMAAHPGAPEEASPITVTLHDGSERPMVLAEMLDVLRRLPTRVNAFLVAVHPTAGCVQMRWEDGRLWLETPDADAQASTGKYATLAEAERTLTILATEHRNAVAGLDGVTTTAW
ncbi:hypothetical protein Aab01nite_15960 [Paractinoplanes abujensis]|uniref:DUF6891 domain-containing protein n=1 Tax=Paractinoplanes abujensis TaxID=882441 RepID=A0A7W7FZZ4_9ACTN|nr:hypothetical protein [Actinoplanes abujensis]MBB4690580.1 hypothetical protein [Actinoplanes abujensis]GID18006.1 hypothetical protein Aab01nite_15960 [Actinoplanes abujensis]